MQHSDVIDALGGTTAVARALRYRHTNVVTRWRRTGIPPHLWHEVADLAAARGLTLTAADLAKTSPLRFVIKRAS